MLFVAVKISRKSENLAEISFGKSWLLAWPGWVKEKLPAREEREHCPPLASALWKNYGDQADIFFGS